MKLFSQKLLFAALFLVITESGFCQSIALAPAQIVEDFKPGVPFEYSLTVENDGPNAVELHVKVTDFWYNDKNEKVFSVPGTSPRSAANWVQFVPEKFQVPAGGKQKMRAIITPPVDARGGYYAVLFVESTPLDSHQQTKDGQRIFTNMRLGCLVMLTAKGSEAYNVNLHDLKLVPPSASQGLKLTFSVDNESNTHIFPQPHLAIVSADHKLAAKAEGQVKRFLPGQKDSMEVDWGGELTAGEYTAVLSLVYGGTHVETRQVAFTVPATSASK